MGKSKATKSAKNKQTEKVARKVVKQELNKELETKFYDTAIVTSGSPTYNGVIYSMVDVPQGLTDVSRIGDKIQPTGIDIRYNVYVGLTGCSIRTIVFRWKAQSAVDTLLVGGILTSTFTAGANATNATYNWDNRQKFDILHDKTESLYGGAKGAVEKVIRIRKGLSRKRVDYYAGSTTNHMNGLYILFITDVILANSPTLSAVSRLYFKDG